MNIPSARNLVWLAALLLGGCVADDAGPVLEFPQGNGEPCKHYQAPGWFPEPTDINPSFADLHLSFNPNNSGEALGIRRRSTAFTTDSIFLLDLTNHTPPRFVTEIVHGLADLRWGAKDWVLINADQIWMMKPNGDSLRPVPGTRSNFRRTYGWNPSGDRFFLTRPPKTWIHALDGSLIDSLVDFVAYSWFSDDSIIGQDYSVDRVHAPLSIYRPSTRTSAYLMPFPESSHDVPTYELYFPYYDIQFHEDKDHFNILAGNSLWIASLRSRSSKEIMYFCYQRCLTDVHFQANLGRLLVEERHAYQLPNLQNVFSFYWVALNPYTGQRLDTLSSFQP